MSSHGGWFTLSSLAADATFDEQSSPPAVRSAPSPPGPPLLPLPSSHQPHQQAMHLTQAVYPHGGVYTEGAALTNSVSSSPQTPLNGPFAQYSRQSQFQPQFPLQQHNPQMLYSQNGFSSQIAPPPPPSSSPLLDAAAWLSIQHGVMRLVRDVQTMERVWVLRLRDPNIVCRSHRRHDGSIAPAGGEACQLSDAVKWLFETFPQLHPPLLARSSVYGGTDEDEGQEQLRQQHCMSWCVLLSSQRCTQSAHDYQEDVLRRGDWIIFTVNLVYMIKIFHASDHLRALTARWSAYAYGDGYAYPLLREFPPKSLDLTTFGALASILDIVPTASSSSSLSSSPGDAASNPYAFSRHREAVQGFFRQVCVGPFMPEYVCR